MRAAGSESREDEDERVVFVKRKEEGMRKMVPKEARVSAKKTGWRNKLLERAMDLYDEAKTRGEKHEARNALIEGARIETTNHRQSKTPQNVAFRTRERIETLTIKGGGE